MLPDRVSSPGPLIYESGALPIALHGPAACFSMLFQYESLTHSEWQNSMEFGSF